MDQGALWSYLLLLVLTVANSSKLPSTSTADVKAKFTRAISADKELVQTMILNGLTHEAWKAGEALFLVMAPPNKGPARIRTLIEDRRESVLTGICPLCHAIADEHHSDDDGISHAVLRHEDDCLIEDNNLGALIHRSYGGTKRNWWSRQVWNDAP